jgi:hypothetical protein
VFSDVFAGMLELVGIPDLLHSHNIAEVTAELLQAGQKQPVSDFATADCRQHQGIMALAVLTDGCVVAAAA